MEQESNSVSRQNRIANYLRSRVTKFITTDCNSSDALEKKHNEISKLAPQGPIYCRTEMHRIEYLRFAVIGMTWAKDPLSRASAGGMDYQELFSQLEASIQQEREEKAAGMRDLAYSGAPRNTPGASDRTPDVFLTVKLDTEGERTQNHPKQKPKRNAGIAEAQTICLTCALKQRT
jgi:hypothetical protein